MGLQSHAITWETFLAWAAVSWAATFLTISFLDVKRLENLSKLFVQRPSFRWILRPRTQHPENRRTVCPIRATRCQKRPDQAVRTLFALQGRASNIRGPVRTSELSQTRTKPRGDLGKCGQSACPLSVGPHVLTANVFSPPCCTNLMPI